MFKAFFDTSRIDAFVADVVQEVQRQLPPADVAKAAERRREKLLLALVRKVEQLLGQGPLNFFQKAKLGTRLQDALEAAGYPQEFSKSFAYDITVQVARSVAPAPKRDA